MGPKKKETWKFRMHTNFFFVTFICEIVIMENATSDLNESEKAINLVFTVSRNLFAPNKLWRPKHVDGLL